MNRQDLLKAVQSRVARAAVTASTVRKSGSKGTAEAARAYLRKANLAHFCVNPAEFKAVLDRKTKSLRARLPKAARHWGLARKLLNIFLRDALYTSYLEGAYHLGRAEAAFEIPLDSITAKHIKKFAGRGELPGWPGVNGVDHRLSAKFQAVAEQAALLEGIQRVHLDAVWWSITRDK